MKPKTKAVIYVTLAMMEPVSKQAALTVDKGAWPNGYELAALLVAMLYLGLLTLKAWSSDSSEHQQPTPTPTEPAP